MILMAMGNDDAAELVLVLKHIGVIGQHQVDTRLRIVGEHETRIDKQHIVAALDNGHVLANTIEATQGDDA